MQPVVRFVANPAEKMLHAHMSGFFTLAAVTDYVEQRQAAFQRLGCGPGEHVTLCDVRDCQVSTQEVLSAFSKALSDPGSRARRIAFVTGSGLLRQQLRRMVPPETACCFDTERDAMIWLKKPG